MKIINRNRIKVILTASIVLMLSYLVFVSIDICLYSKVDERVASDAAIILGAGVWDGKLSPVFEERMNHGIWLYKNGYVDKLIITGGIPKGKSQSDSSAARAYAMEKSIPSEDIFIEEHSTITEENILYALEIVEGKGYSKVILVSDPLHMKRAMLMARDYGLNAYSSPTPTTQYRTLKSQTLFLAREVFFYIGYNLKRLVD